MCAHYTANPLSNCVLGLVVLPLALSSSSREPSVSRRQNSCADRTADQSFSHRSLISKITSDRRGQSARICALLADALVRAGGGHFFLLVLFLLHSNYEIADTNCDSLFSGKKKKKKLKNERSKKIGFQNLAERNRGVKKQYGMLPDTEPREIPNKFRSFDFRPRVRRSNDRVRRLGDPRRNLNSARSSIIPCNSAGDGGLRDCRLFIPSHGARRSGLRASVRNYFCNAVTRRVCASARVRSLARAQPPSGRESE